MESANDPVAVPILKPPHTRVAILDGGGFSIQDVVSGDFHEFRERVAELVLGALSGHTFNPPETALREILDNLVHAVPCSASVVVDPSLERVYISDTGPGIIHPDLAMEPGYTTATEVHRSVIRGVGLGFYLARKEVEEIGGELRVFSHPGQGTYVSICFNGRIAAPPHPDVGMPFTGEGLSHRQNNILFLLTEEEFVGPSRVAAELGISISTAHRELTKLERMGFIDRSSDGKRFLSGRGRSYLQSILSL